MPADGRGGCRIHQAVSGKMRSSRVKFEDGAAALAAGCAFSAENIRTDDGGLESPDDGCRAGMKKTGSRRDYEEEAAPSFPEVTPTRSPDGGWGMRKNDGRRRRRRRRDDSRDVSSRTPCESRPSRRHRLPSRPSRRRSSSLRGNLATTRDRDGRTRSALIAATSWTKTTYLPSLSLLLLLLLFTFAAASTLAQVMDGTGTGGYPTQTAGEAASSSSTEDESETTPTTPTTTTTTTTTTTEKGLLASTKLRSFGGRLWSFKTSDGGKTLSAVVDAIRSSTDHDRSLLSSLARRRTLLFPTPKLISARSDDEKVTWIKPAPKEGRSRLSSKFSDATVDPAVERDQAQGPPPPSSEGRPPALLVDPGGNGSNSTAESADPPVAEAEPAISWTNTTTAAAADGEAGHRQPGSNSKGTKAKTGKRLRESPIYYIKMNPLLPPPPPPPPPPAPSSPLFMLPDFSSWANQNPAAAPVFHQQSHHQHNYQQQQQQQQQPGIFAGLSRSSAGLLNYLPLNFRANGKPSLALTSRQQLQPPFWQTVLQQQQQQQEQQGGQLMLDPYSANNYHNHGQQQQQQLSGGNGFHYQAQQQSGDLWAQQQHHNKQRLMQVGYQQHQGHPNHHYYHQGQQSLDSNVIHLPLDFRINGKPHSVFHYPASLDNAAAPHKTSLLFSGLSQQQQTGQGTVLAGKKPKISFGYNPTTTTTTTSTTTTTTEAPDNAGIGSLFPDALGRNSPVHNLRNRYYFNGKPTGVFVFNTLKRYPYLYRNLQDLLVQSPLL